MSLYGFNQNKIYGVNEDSLRDSAVKLYEYIDDMKTKFNSIEDVVDNVKDCYVSSLSKDILTKFELFKDNFEIMMGNFELYSKDMIKAIGNFKEIDSSFKSVNKEE